MSKQTLLSEAYQTIDSYIKASCKQYVNELYKYTIDNWHLIRQFIKAIPTTKYEYIIALFAYMNRTKSKIPVIIQYRGLDITVYLEFNPNKHSISAETNDTVNKRWDKKLNYIGLYPPGINHRILKQEDYRPLYKNVEEIVNVLAHELRHVDQYLKDDGSFDSSIIGYVEPASQGVKMDDGTPMKNFSYLVQLLYATQRVEMEAELIRAAKQYKHYRRKIPFINILIAQLLKIEVVKDVEHIDKKHNINSLEDLAFYCLKMAKHSPNIDFVLNYFILSYFIKVYIPTTKYANYIPNLKKYVRYVGYGNTDLKILRSLFDIFYVLIKENRISTWKGAIVRNSNLIRLLLYPAKPLPPLFKQLKKVSESDMDAAIRAVASDVFKNETNDKLTLNEKLIKLKNKILSDNTLIL